MSSIPAGRYNGRARADSMQFGYANSGSEQVVVTFDLLNEGYEGRTVTFFGSFASDKSTEITLRQLRDAGWSGEALTDTTGLGDLEVALEVKYEEYQGKQRMKVAVYPLNGTTFVVEKPVAGQNLAALNARLKGAILKSKKPATGGAAPAAWTPPPAGDNGAPATGGAGDNIPF